MTELLQVTSYCFIYQVCVKMTSENTAEPQYQIIYDVYKCKTSATVTTQTDPSSPFVPIATDWYYSGCHIRFVFVFVFVNVYPDDSIVILMFTLRNTMNEKIIELHKRFLLLIFFYTTSNSCYFNYDDYYYY